MSTSPGPGPEAPREGTTRAGAGAAGFTPGIAVAAAAADARAPRTSAGGSPKEFQVIHPYHIETSERLISYHREM